MTIANRCRLSLVLLFGMIACPRGAFSTVPDEKAEFFEKLLQASIRYQEAIDTAQGTARVECKQIPPGPYGVNTSEVEFHRNRGKILIRRVLTNEVDPSMHYKFVHGRDDTGAYFVERDEKLGRDLLRSFLTNAELEGETPSDISFYLERFMLSPISLSAVVVNTLTSNPSFKLTSLEKTPSGAYRIHYDLAKSSTIYGPGWFEVSPETGWLIGKSSCRVGGQNSSRTMMTSIEYGPTYQGSPIPKDVRIHLSSEGKPPVAKEEDYRLTLGGIEADNLAAADYSVDQFKLPDLTRRSSGAGRFSTATLLLLLAIAGILAAIALRVMARRRERVDGH